MTEPQAARRRRALADLLPATLATGVAGLVVSVLVGGTTTGLHSALSERDATDAPAYVADAAGAAPGDGITVRVRPSAPKASGLAAALDLAPTDAVASAPAAVARRAAATRAARSETAVASPSPVTTSAPDAIVLVAAVPEPIVEVLATKAKRSGRTSKARAGESTLTAASSGWVALDGAAATTTTAGADGDAGTDTADERRRHSHEAPPPHAPAYGRRT